MKTCRFVAKDQPRMVKNRHEDDCADDECRGCLPCTEDHCRVQSKPYSDDDEPCQVHATSTCPSCLGRVRTHILEIVRMWRMLPSEVVNDGVDSEAMAMLGPVANPESWGHHKASALVGRIVPVGSEAKDADEVRAHYDDRNLAPLWVLGSWQMMAEDEYGGPSDERVEVNTAADWLLDKLHWLAADMEFPFEQLAADVRDCRRHLERVLHDGEQVERTRIPCLSCGRRLEFQYADDAGDDHHVCSGCQRTYDAAEVTLAKADLLSREEAERMVLIADAAHAIDRSERTIRTWVNRDKVTAACDMRSHRLVVWWPDVRQQASEMRMREMQRMAS